MKKIAALLLVLLAAPWILNMDRKHAVRVYVDEYK